VANVVQDKFPRARNGYDMQYVDAIIEDFQREVDDLKKQRAALMNAKAEHEAKIQLLEQNYLRLEAERARENARLTSVLSSAVKVAEETEQQASVKALEIIEVAKAEAVRIAQKAQDDLAAARQSMMQLSRDAQEVYQGNEQFVTRSNAWLSELSTFLYKSANGIPSGPLPIATQPKEPLAPLVFTPPPLPDEPIKQAPLQGEEAFIEFLRSKGL